MIAPEYFNNHIAVEGEIIVKRVPNDTGSVLVWNSTTKKISTRTVSEIVSDLSLMTTNTPQEVMAGKNFLTTQGGSWGNNSLSVYTKDGVSNPAMNFHKGGVDIAQLSFDGGAFHFYNSNSSNYRPIVTDGFYKNGSSDDYFLMGGGGQLTKYAKDDSFVNSGRDFTNGTLITTNIDYSQTNGEPFLLEMKGNMYGGGAIPLDCKVEGYIYSDTIINCSGYATNPLLANIVTMNIGGNLCFWFPRMGYWHGFSVKVVTTGGGSITTINRVTSIVDSVEPSGTKKVNIPIQTLATSGQLGNYVSKAGDTMTGALNTTDVGITGGLFSQNITGNQMMYAGGGVLFVGNTAGLTNIRFESGGDLYHFNTNLGNAVVWTGHNFNPNDYWKITDTIDYLGLNYLKLSGGTLTSGGKIKPNCDIVVQQNDVGGNATGLFWESIDNTQNIAGIGTYTENGNFGFSYIGWGSSPWAQTENLSVAENIFHYKNRRVWHEGILEDYHQYGLGSYTQQNQINIDNPRETGFYSYFSGATTGDSPYGYATILHQAYMGNNEFSQIAIRKGGEGMAFRTDTTPWREVYHEGTNKLIRLDSSAGIANGSDSRTNKFWFDYNWAGTGGPGSVINFSGFGGGYSTEIFASYGNGGKELGFRTRNGDTSQWNLHNWVWHTGNFNPSDYQPSGQYVRVGGQSTTGNNILLGWTGSELRLTVDVTTIGELWHTGNLPDYRNYGLGTTIVPVLPDLNTYSSVASGFYSINDAQNAPYNYGTVLKMMRSADEGTEIATSVWGNGLAFRGYVGGSYNTWQEVWHTGNFNPANYQPAGSYVTTNTTQDINAEKTFRNTLRVIGSNVNSNTTKLTIGNEASSNWWALSAGLNGATENGFFIGHWDSSLSTYNWDLNVNADGKVSARGSLDTPIIISPNLNGGQVIHAGNSDSLYISNPNVSTVYIESAGNDLFHNRIDLGVGRIWDAHNFNPDNKVNKSGDTMTGNLNALTISAQNASDKLIYDNIENYGSPLKINANASLGIYLQADGNNKLYVGPSYNESLNDLYVTSGKLFSNYDTNSNDWGNAYKNGLVNRGVSLTSNVDANNFGNQQSGIYSVEFGNGSNNTNFPINNGYGTFMKMSANSFTSELFHANGGELWHRNWYFGSTPSSYSFRKIWDNENFNPAQYVTQSSLNSNLVGYATLAGVQTFQNTNTFLQSPVIPNGTLGSHAVNLSQLSNYATTAQLNDYVTVNTPQNISGLKTFYNTLAIANGQSIFLKGSADTAHYIKHFADDKDGFGVSTGFVVKRYDEAVDLFTVSSVGFGEFNQNVRAGGFLKAGSSNAYVLLGQGDHKPLSDFAMNDYLPNQNWGGHQAISGRKTVGELAWKNYGSGHTIFDISSGIAPWGVSKSNVDAEIPWSPSYPTLVGGNGANTYGVRVDSARVSDNTNALGGVGSDGWVRNIENTYGIGFQNGNVNLAPYFYHSSGTYKFLATQEWVNTNFIPKSHPVYNITQADINSWNSAGSGGSSHTHSNLNLLNNIDQWLGVGQSPSFTNVNLMNNIGYGHLVFGENNIGGEIGIVDLSNDRFYAGRMNEYLKYGSSVNDFEGLNIHFDAKLLSIGKEIANDEDKVQVAGNISVNTPNIGGDDMQLILNPLHNTNGDVRDSRNAHIYIVTRETVRLPNRPILGQRIEIFNFSANDIEVMHENVGTLFYLPGLHKVTGVVGGKGFIFDEKPVPAKHYGI